jgi:hypothetical protein
VGKKADDIEIPEKQPEHDICHIFFWRAGHIMLSQYGFRQADQPNSTTNHGGH